MLRESFPLHKECEGTAKKILKVIEAHKRFKKRNVNLTLRVKWKMIERIRRKKGEKTSFDEDIYASCYKVKSL